MHWSRALEQAIQTVKRHAIIRLLYVTTLVLAGQSLGELTALEQSVEQALQTGDGDPEYWEAVQKRLRIYKAKAQVRDRARRNRSQAAGARGRGSCHLVEAGAGASANSSA